MTIGEKIKYLRNRLNITQSSLANKANIHPVSIRKYETNKMIPQPTQIEKLAKALKINPYYLCTNNIYQYKKSDDIFSVILLLSKMQLVNMYVNKEDEICIEPNNNIFLNRATGKFVFNQTDKQSEKYKLLKEYIILNRNFVEIRDDISSVVSATTKNLLENKINVIQNDIDVLELRLLQLEINKKCNLYHICSQLKITNKTTEEIKTDKCPNEEE